MKLLLSTLLISAALVATVPAQSTSGFLVHTGDAAPSVLVEAVAGEGEAGHTLVLMIDFESPASRTMLEKVESTVHENLSSRGLSVVAIARGADEAAARRGAEELGLTFDVVPDEDRALSLLIADRAVGVPRALLVDPDGTIVYQSQGYAPGREAEYYHAASARLEGRDSRAITRVQSITSLPAREGALPSAGLRLSARNVIGEEAPEFHVDRWLTNEPGETDGKYVMTEFFATWCGPCIAVMPHLEKLHAEESERLVVRSISDEPESVLEQFLRNRQVNYPLGVDAQGVSKRAINVRGIPTAYITNPDGIVVWQGHPAQLNDSQILERILSGSHVLSREGQWIAAAADQAD